MTPSEETLRRAQDYVNECLKNGVELPRRVTVPNRPGPAVEVPVVEWRNGNTIWFSVFPDGRI